VDLGGLAVRNALCLLATVQVAKVDVLESDNADKSAEDAENSLQARVVCRGSRIQDVSDLRRLRTCLQFLLTVGSIFSLEKVRACE
jgi:hypothetical protein